jgi:hypothetical protein
MLCLLWHPVSTSSNALTVTPHNHAQGNSFRFFSLASNDRRIKWAVSSICRCLLPAGFAQVQV